MTGREFTARAARARRRAEEEHLAEFAAAWQQAIEDAAGVLSRGLTAAAEWQPPHGDQLDTAIFVALIARFSSRLGEIRLRSYRTVAKALRVRLRSLDPVDRQNDLTGARLRDAVRRDLDRLTTKAHADGLSVTDAERVIEQGIMDVAPARGEMLARTELNALANSASVTAAREAGIAFKGWISARDPRVRDPHAAADGQIVPLGEQFVVCDGQRCDAPGDPALSDDCLCNCRCTLVYGMTLAEVGGLLASAGVSTMPAMASVAPSSRLAARRRAADREPDDPSAAVAIPPDDAEQPAEALTAAAKPIPFSGVAAVEGVISDDNTPIPRVLLPNSLTWPELPVPLMAQTVTADGHDGAELSGRIDFFSRTKKKEIRFGGELTTAFGIETIAPAVDDKSLRFVSIDLGASEFDLVFRDTLKPVPEDEGSEEDALAGKYALGLSFGKVKAATLVPTPALGGTSVALTASADGTEVTLTFQAVLAFGAPEAEDEDDELDRAFGLLRSVVGIRAELDAAPERVATDESDDIAMVDSLTRRIAHGEPSVEVLTSAIVALIRARS